MIRLKKVAKDCNVNIRTIIEYLAKNGYQIDSNPNMRINQEQYKLVYAEFYGKRKQNEIETFGKDVENNTFQDTKERDGESSIQTIVNNDLQYEKEVETSNQPETSFNTTNRISASSLQHITDGKYYDLKVVGKIDLESLNTKKRPDKLRKKISSRGEKETALVQESQITNSVLTKTANTKQTVYFSFSSLIFKDRKILLNYMGKEYFHDFKKGEYCNYLISKNKELLPSEEWEKYERYQIPVLLDNNNGQLTFEFVDFNLYSFIVEMCDKVRNTINLQTESNFDNGENPSISSDPTKEILLPNIQQSSLGIDNIEFYDGFYLIWLLKNGEKDTSISPLRVNDTCSYTFLHLVHKYLSNNFPLGIQIVYSEKTIIELTKPYLLSNYIRVLHDNIDIRGEWWEEVQNERKPSLKQCRQITTAELKKKVSLKNGYLDNLSSLQNNKKLIPVYEINHGKQEDAFLFTIDMPNNKCAVIFENTSFAATATEIFITKNDNYESCIELVFDYFTDYTINTKRESLRRRINPPKKFNAENHFVVNHYDLEQWMSTIFKILEQSPKQASIEFVSGLNIPADYMERTISSEIISTKNIHNKLIRQLYYKLSNEYGAANVGTEIRVGSKRIDTVVKLANRYDIYEIKTTNDPFSCVTLALGQLCQYAYLFCRDKIGKMIIVGPSESTKEVDDYLTWFRNTYVLPIFYMHIPI